MIRQDKESNRENELKGKGIVVRVRYLSIGGGGDTPRYHIAFLR